MASCCVQSLVPARRKRHCGVKQEKLVFFLRIITKSKVKSHFKSMTKVTAPAKLCNVTVQKFY